MANLFLKNGEYLRDRGPVILQLNVYTNFSSQLTWQQSLCVSENENEQQQVMQQTRGVVRETALLNIVRGWCNMLRLCCSYPSCQCNVVHLSGLLAAGTEPYLWMLKHELLLPRLNDPCLLAMLQQTQIYQMYPTYHQKTEYHTEQGWVTSPPPGSNC